MHHRPRTDISTQQVAKNGPHGNLLYGFYNSILSSQETALWIPGGSHRFFRRRGSWTVAVATLQPKVLEYNGFILSIRYAPENPHILQRFSDVVVAALRP
jgi:hypothetical protein